MNRAVARSGNSAGHTRPHSTDELVAFEAAKAHAIERGYAIVASQPALFEGSQDGLRWLFDLVMRSTPLEPVMSVYHYPSGHRPERLARAVSAISRGLAVPLVSLTNDGRSFLTVAVGNTVARSLDFLPHALGNVREPHRYQDLTPFTDLYNLRHFVSRLSDAIFAAFGHDRLKLFDSVLLMLVAKVHDEVHHANDLQVPRILREQEAAISGRFEQFCGEALEHIGVTTFDRRLHLDPDTLRTCLGMLAPYSLRLTLELGGPTEALATFYQEVVSSTFRGTLGAYFTPRPVAELVAEICGVGPTDTVLDFSCGSGTLLLSAYESTTARKGATSGPAVYGSDIQERMVVTTALNCYLHGVFEPHLTQGDGLRLDLPAWRSRDPEVPEDGFSVIVGNPPFAGFESAEFLPYRPRHTAKVHKVIPFIAKTVQLLKPGGKAGLVLPMSVLNGESADFSGLRSWLAEEVELTELLSLSKDAFVHTDTGVEGALVFFRKRPAGNPSSRQSRRIFFTPVGSLGYDRRGRRSGVSDASEVLDRWRQDRNSENSSIPADILYQLDRWDPAWLADLRRKKAHGHKADSIWLTELCHIEKRLLSHKAIVLDAEYRCFEVGDTDIDTGMVQQLRRLSGRELARKGRLRVPVESGDVLLPNHRDSLVAKSAAGGRGRSAVLVTEEHAGCITSNRFTVLRPVIDARLLVAILNSSEVRRQLVLHARGSASFDIRAKVLRQVWVPRRIVDDPGTLEAILAAMREREKLQQELAVVTNRLVNIVDAVG